MRKILPITLAGILGIVSCDQSDNTPVEESRTELSDVTTRFSPKFSDSETTRLSLIGVSPKETEEYFKVDDELNSRDVVSMAEEGLTPDLLRQYSDVWRSGDKRRIHRDIKVEPLEANTYLDSFDKWDSITLMESGISNDNAKAYLTDELTFRRHKDRRFGKFNVGDVVTLYEKDAKPEIVNEYSRSFTPIDVKTLVQNDVGAEEANRYATLNNKYLARISGIDIVNFRFNEIPFEEVEAKAREVFLYESIEN
jgi:hypothetical protein